MCRNVVHFEYRPILWQCINLSVQTWNRTLHPLYWRCCAFVSALRPSLVVHAVYGIFYTRTMCIMVLLSMYICVVQYLCACAFVRTGDYHHVRSFSMCKRVSVSGRIWGGGTCTCGVDGKVERVRTCVSTRRTRPQRRARTQYLPIGCACACVSSSASALARVSSWAATYCMRACQSNILYIHTHERHVTNAMIVVCATGRPTIALRAEIAG